MNNPPLRVLEFEPPIGLCLAHRLENLEEQVMGQLPLVPAVGDLRLV